MKNAIASPATALLLALATLGTGACTRQHARALDEGTLVTVSAHGESRHAPDIAMLSTGVESVAPDPSAAIRMNSERMTAVVAAIEAAGIAKKDVQTSGVSLNPQYSYKAGQSPRIDGYDASNTVEVTVHDIARLGEIMDVLVRSGANNINGPSFDIADKDAVMNEARDRAVAKARSQAEGYARRLGMRVGRVVSIDETGGRAMPMAMVTRTRMVAATDAAAMAAAPPPISPGENVLGVDVDVIYELVN